MTIVETRCSVTAGVDTHADVHVAAVIDHLGGVLGIEAFDTSAAGCRALVGWLRSHGEINLVGVEGTGSYGAGVCRHLTVAGIAVVEVDRPNRQARRREGKTDTVDAVAAARAALSGQAVGRPKSRDGDVEAIRVLQVACRSAASERIATLCQLRHLVICADDQVRSRFDGLTVARLTAQTATLRPRRTDTVRYSTLLAIRTLGRRVASLDDELDELTAVIRPLIDRTAPGLLAMYGVGYDVAAKLLVAAGDNPRPAPFRSRVRPHVRRRPARGVLRQDPPTPSQPGWQPASQQRPLPHRHHPHGLTPADPRLRRPTTRRRQIDR